MIRSYNLRGIVGKLLPRIFIFLVLLVIITPLIWMFSLSFRTDGGIHDSYFYIFPKSIDTGNYAEAFELAEIRKPSVFSMYKNSFIVVITAVIITLILSTMAGYAFSRFNFKGRDAIFYIIILTMMIPTESILIPIFIFSSKVGILYTYYGLILAYVALQIPFATFVMRQFFLHIPNEIMESARIDGATEFAVFYRIALPLAKPALATTITLLFMSFWNEFILALILMLRKELFTLPIGLTSLVGELYTPWPVYAAMVFISVGPIIIIFAIFQNWFIKGLAAGALKA